MHRKSLFADNSKPFHSEILIPSKTSKKNLSKYNKICNHKSEKKMKGKQSSNKIIEEIKSLQRNVTLLAKTNECSCCKKLTLSKTKNGFQDSSRKYNEDYFSKKSSSYNNPEKQNLFLSEEENDMKQLQIRSLNLTIKNLQRENEELQIKFQNEKYQKLMIQKKLKKEQKSRSKRKSENYFNENEFSSIKIKIPEYSFQKFPLNQSIPSIKINNTLQISKSLKEDSFDSNLLTSNCQFRENLFLEPKQVLLKIQNRGNGNILRSEHLKDRKEIKNKNININSQQNIESLERDFRELVEICKNERNREKKIAYRKDMSQIAQQLKNLKENIENYY